MRSLKQIREALGLTQQQMAEKLGYSSYVSISYFENGAQSIPQQALNYLKQLDFDLGCLECGGTAQLVPVTFMEDVNGPNSGRVEIKSSHYECRDCGEAWRSREQAVDEHNQIMAARNELSNKTDA